MMQSLSTTSGTEKRYEAELGITLPQRTWQQTTTTMIKDRIYWAGEKPFAITCLDRTQTNPITDTILASR